MADHTTGVQVARSVCSVTAIRVLVAATQVLICYEPPGDSSAWQEAAAMIGRGKQMRIALVHHLLK